MPFSQYVDKMFIFYYNDTWINIVNVKGFEISRRNYHFEFQQQLAQLSSRLLDFLPRNVLP